MPKARNVLNGPLETCGTDPITGFTATAAATQAARTSGFTSFCAEMTAEFLAFYCIAWK